MSIKLPSVTVSDTEYEELARHVGRYGDYVTALKSGDVSIADKISFRAWYLLEADLQRDATTTVTDMAGPAIG